MSDSAPICIAIIGTPSMGCLPISYRIFLSDVPDALPPEKLPPYHKRYIWKNKIKILGNGYNNDTKVRLPKTKTIPMKSYVKKYRDKDKVWDSSLLKNGRPNWLKCGFEQWAMVYKTWGTQETVCDYSVVSKVNYKNIYLIKSHFTMDISLRCLEKSQSIGSSNQDGWSLFLSVILPQVGFWKFFQDYSGFFAATSLVYFKKPLQTESTPIKIRSCLGYPYGILAGQFPNLKIIRSGQSYRVSCSRCIWTNCIDSSLVKTYSITKILQRPSYVILPVDLKNDAWFDNEALQTLKRVNEFIRPKHFVAVFMLGISALIAIVTSLTVSSVALVSEIKTAHFVNDLNKNVSLALER